MDKLKAKAVKSKPSINVTNPKSKKKKSGSNTEFQPRVLKKRGVYVEKATKINTQDLNISTTQKIKGPPRPRPGKKPFLASVLTILSKSTTGTQLPEAEVMDIPRNVDNYKLRTKRLKYIDDNKIDVTHRIFEGTKRFDSNNKTKPKHTSKILNDTKSEQEQLKILQTNKDIIQTPSIFSERSSKEDTLKFSDLPRLVKNDDYPIIRTDFVTSINSSIAKEVLEGKMKKIKKVTLVDNEPLTLVSDEPKKDEKKLYNFFVELLKTSFSLHNLKSEQSFGNVNNSKIQIEKDESLAKKVQVTSNEAPEISNDLTQSPSRYFYSIKNGEEALSDHQLMDYFKTKATNSKWSKQEVPLKASVRFKRRPIVWIGGDSHTKRIKEAVKPEKSVMNKNKSLYKKNKKKDLLNLLKEQLRMDDQTLEEPQNLYQALKQIARNKRKCRQAIHFNYTAKKINDGYDNSECMFKRRKVISPSTRCSKKYKPESEYLRSMRPISWKCSESEYSRSKYTKSRYTIDNEADSYHSLEVFGYDFDDIPSRSALIKNKQIVYTGYSSSTMTGQQVYI